MAIKASKNRDSNNTQVLKCPGCGKAIWISPKINGQMVECPFCARNI